MANVFLNPKNKTDNCILSNNNSTVEFSSVNGYVRLNKGIKKGKKYFEVNTNTNANGITIGVAKDNIDLTWNTGYCFYYQGYTYPSKTGGTSSSYQTGNHTIGVAIDLDSSTKTVSFYLDNVLIKAETVTDTGLLYPYINQYYYSPLPNPVTINLNGFSFKYDIPQGYQPYDNTNCFIKRDNQYYTINETGLILLENQNLDKENFINNGLDLDLLKDIDKTDLKLVAYNESNELSLKVIPKEPYRLVDKYENLKLLAYDETEPESMEMGYTLREPFTPIDKFSNDCEICSDFDSENLTAVIKGEKRERYNYKVEFGDEVVKNVITLTGNDTDETFNIPVDFIKSIKNEKKDVMFKVTKNTEFGDSEEEEFMITINPQRIFSKTFNGTTSYITIYNWKKPLVDLDVQVIKKASTETDFTVDTSTTLLSIVNGDLIIGKTNFVGDIYEVRLWEKGKAQEYTGQPLLGNEKGLFLYLRMNEYNSNICMDSSENKLNGIYVMTTTSERVPSNASSLYDVKITMIEEDMVEQKKAYSMKYKIEKPVEHEFNIYDLKLNENNMVEIPINFALFENIENMKFIDKSVDDLPKYKASSYYPSSSDAWSPKNAFDGNIETSWQSNSGTGVTETMPQWIWYKFDEASCVTGYFLNMKTAGSKFVPSKWQLQGSNDGENWDILDEQTKTTAWVKNTKIQYPISNTKKYRLYRIYVLEAFGTTYVDIGEIGFTIDNQ